MNIHNLKKIVNDFETNALRASDSKFATADNLVILGIQLDKWLIDAVEKLNGDTSTVIRNNETALEMALDHILFDYEI